MLTEFVSFHLLLLFSFKEPLVEFYSFSYSFDCPLLCNTKHFLKLEDEPCWSIVARNLEDVEKFFKQTIDNRFSFTTFLGTNQFSNFFVQTILIMALMIPYYFHCD